MKTFAKTTVFITGGSSGIGLAAARALSERGARPVLFARGREGLERAAALVPGSSVFPLDVADRSQVEAVLAEAVATCGPPDLLVNSAGVSLPGYFEQLTFDEFDRTMRVNLYGTWNTCQVLAPFLRRQRGHIVNVASVAGFVGVFGYSAYAASKFGVIGFSEALRAEMKPHGVGVSVLCPPDVDTPMLAAEASRKPLETAAIAGAAKVMSPERVVAAMLAGVAAGRFLIVPGLDAKFTEVSKRWAPGLVAWVTDRLARQGRSASGAR